MYSKKEKKLFKKIKIFYKVIKIPTYIFISLGLLNSMSTKDITGIALSLVVLGLVTTLGNDLKLISNLLLDQLPHLGGWNFWTPKWSIHKFLLR